MPAPVDHEARRREVTEIASRLIAEGGPEAASFREIAKAAGYSTSVVSHYFRSKHDLLLYMFSVAAQNGVDRITAAMKAGELPLACVEAVLPMDKQRRQDWHVVLAFWGKAATDPDFRKEQRRRGREMLSLVMQVLQSEPARLETKEADAHARTLLTVIVGLATQAIFDPEAWSARRQRAVLKELFESHPNFRV